ncbi:hypothetical protein [Mycobacterium intracellulare]|nr:hypothetical protein [Mycobacterium intracellulare]
MRSRAIISDVSATYTIFCAGLGVEFGEAVNQAIRSHREEVNAL